MEHMSGVPFHGPNRGASHLERGQGMGISARMRPSSFASAQSSRGTCSATDPRFSATSAGDACAQRSVRRGCRGRWAGTAHHAEDDLLDDGGEGCEADSDGGQADAVLVRERNPLGALGQQLLVVGLGRVEEDAV